MEQALDRRRSAKRVVPVETAAEQELTATKAYVKRITQSKEASIAFLKRAGILDKKTGELSKPYRT